MKGGFHGTLGTPPVFATDTHTHIHTHIHTHTEAGLDYTVINDTSCSLSDSLPRCCINITVLQDTLVELKEYFRVTVRLNSSDPIVLLGRSVATVALTDSSCECLHDYSALSSYLNYPQLSPYPWSSLPTLRWLVLMAQ